MKTGHELNCCVFISHECNSNYRIPMLTIVLIVYALCISVYHFNILQVCCRHYVTDTLKVCMKNFNTEKIILTYLQHFQLSQFSTSAHVEQVAERQ